MTNRAAAQLVNMLSGERPQPAEIDRQQRQDGAELDQHGERLAEVVAAPAEHVLHQQQMAGGGDGQEFGQALDHAEHGGLDQVDGGRGQAEAHHLHGVDRHGRD